MRIVGFRAANAASTQYRTTNWINAMRNLGHDAQEFASPVQEYPRIDSILNGADIVLYGITVEAHEIAILQAGQANYGYKLIVDTDDLVNQVPRYNQASTMYHNATGLVRIAEAQYRDCDAITVSTPELKQKMDHYNANVVYMPNVVDPALYEGIRIREKEARHSDDLRIYWGGGGGHWDDLVIVKNTLLRIAGERPNVKLVFSNLVPGWAMDLPIMQVYYIPLQPFPRFRQLMSWLCVDVGLAPLVDNQFNRCKSHVKYIDYAMAKVAGVYSDLAPYDSVQENDTGLKARA